MTIATLLISYPAGWLTDKMGPYRTILLSYLIAVASGIVGYPAKDATQLSIAVVLMAISGTIGYNALLVYLVQGIPRELLASFSACNGMFSAFFPPPCRLFAGY